LRDRRKTGRAELETKVKKGKIQRKLGKVGRDWKEREEPMRRKERAIEGKWESDTEMIEIR
jgi:hypothetical protein